MSIRRSPEGSRQVPPEALWRVFLAAQEYVDECDNPAPDMVMRSINRRALADRIRELEEVRPSLRGSWRTDDRGRQPQRYKPLP